MIKYLFQWFYCKSEMGGNISRHYGPFQFSCRRETIEFSRSNIVAGICYENLFCLWIYRQPVRYFDRFEDFQRNQKDKCSYQPPSHENRR